jgi:hypothetical protein
MTGICVGSPHQGLSGARRGLEFHGIFLMGSLIRREEAPPGAAAFITTGEMEVTLHSIAENDRLMGKKGLHQSRKISFSGT